MKPATTNDRPETRDQRPETRRGQITIEYFLFFAAMIMILLYVLSQSNKVQKGTKDFVNDAANKTVNLIQY